MKRKIILLTIILLLLTGCKVEYKINLDEKLNIEENINLISTSEKDEMEFKDFSLNIPINKEVDDYGSFITKIDDLKYYDSIKKDGIIQFHYNYKNNDYDEYINSSLVNRAYEYVSISKLDDKTLILSSSKEFLLFNNYDNLEEVKITVHTNYKVLSNNADEVNNHDYTWIINEDNAYGKGIYLKIDTSKEDLTFMEKFMRGDYFNIFTLTLMIVVIVFVIYIILKKYSQKRDEI